MAGDVYSGNVRTLGMVSSSDLNNRFSSSRNKWERVSNGRYWMAHDALTRGGASSLDADRLARILAAQSALEAGWEDSVSSNNYAGYMSNGRKMRFSSPEAFWDYHIKNLDEKWPGWRSARTIDEYYRTVNHPELGLDTQKKFDDYNKAHHDSPVYIYAPEWDNSDYRQNLFNVYNNYINKYVPALEYSDGGKMGRIQLLAKRLQESGKAGAMFGKYHRYDGKSEPTGQMSSSDRRRYNGKDITLDEYKQIQRDTVRDAAVQKALSREYGIAPIINGAVGTSCLYTVTDNFGNQYRVPGNQTFLADPERYGFTINGPIENAQIGDLYQLFNDKGVPDHMTMITGYANDGQPLVSYSRGSAAPTTDLQTAIRMNKIMSRENFEKNKDRDPYAGMTYDEYVRKYYADYLDNLRHDYVKNAPLWNGEGPMTDDMIDSPGYETYRFVGTDKDNKRWESEYDMLPRSYNQINRLPGIKTSAFSSTSNNLVSAHKFDGKSEPTGQMMRTDEDGNPVDSINPAVYSLRDITGLKRKDIKRLAELDALSGEGMPALDTGTDWRKRVYGRKFDKTVAEAARQQEKQALFNAAVDELRSGKPTGAFKELTKEGIESAAPLAMGIVGAAAAPVLLEGTASAYAIPQVKTALDVAGSLDGVRNLVSGNGIRKTIGYINDGNYGRAALSGLGDTFDLFGGVGLLKDARSLFNLYSGKNLIDSRRIMHGFHKEIERAADNNARHAAQNKLRQGASAANGDLVGMSLYSVPATKADRYGRFVFTKYPGQMPYVYKGDNIIDAVQYAQEALTPPMSREAVMKEIGERSRKLPSGKRVSMIDDMDLSKDSYSLLQSVLLKNHLSGNGTLSVVKDGDVYRMIRLNPDGIRKQSIKEIDNKIEKLRDILNDPNIPRRVSIGGRHYVPALTLKKHGGGGEL